MKRAPPVMPSSYSTGETDLFAVMLVFGNVGALSAGSSDVVSALYFRNVKETTFREVHRWLLLAQYLNTLSTSYLLPTVLASQPLKMLTAG